MRKFNFTKTLWFMAVAGLLASSCDTNDEIIPNNPDEEFDVTLDVSEGGGTPVEDVTVDANTQSTIKAKVDFTSTDTDMKRLYITQNINGSGEEPYMPSENVDDKADGSIDISGSSGKEFEFEFDLPVPSGVADGTVEYKFWATSGKGDFRDESKRLVAGPGTIVLKYGTGSNPEAEVKYYEDVQFEAPLEEGTSETFISLLDGKLYTINQGSEYVAYWDFGYFYGGASHASIASTYNYPRDIIDIEAISGTTNEFNHAYFAISTKTSEDFDNVELSSDLDFITQPEKERVSMLEAGDIVEFVDQYGKKGLIRINEIEGTYNLGDYMTVDIKVQP